MMFIFFLTVVVCLQLWPFSPVTSYSSLENNNGGCGTSDSDRTWTSYLDEKCIKIFDKLVNFKEAESICQKDYYYYDDSQYQYEARLVTINSAEEQAFLQDFLFEKNDLSDSVWLGAMWNPNVTGNATEQFEWHRAGGQTDLWGPYTNWRKGYPRGLPKKNVTFQAEVTGVLGNANDNNKTCVEMSAGVDEATGQWINEPCSKNNRVVCERRQKWKDTKIQELLEKVTRQQNVLLQQNAELKRKVDEYIEQKNKSDSGDEVQLKGSKIAVPVGFVYVQLPGELAPEVVFPSSSEDNLKSSSPLWKDISPNFEGVFFRVAGSQSGPFGAVQEQSAPAIDAIKRNWCFVGADGACNHHDAYNGQSADAKDQISLSSSRGTGTGNGTWSEPIWTVNKYVANGTGEEGPFYGEYLNFHTTNVEVRPRNMAVKVKYVQILPSGCLEKGDGLGNRSNCSAPVSHFLTSNLVESDDKFCSNDGWSALLWTAFNYASLSEAYDDVKAYADYHQYHLSSSSAIEAGTAEVRPRNMAVKVWKRTG